MSEIISKIKALLGELNAVSPANAEEVEQLRIKYLGQKGLLKDLFAQFKEVPNEQKKEFGQKINELKIAAEQKVEEGKAKFSGTKKASNQIDLSAPGVPFNKGSRHPLTLVRQEIIEIFSRIGFTVADGPEIEDDWHNFSALNFPPEHPARDMQDTFFIDKEIALRTHTSSIQIRIMETEKPPIRILAPGRVYRNEAISARAHCFFHQIEGLYIDKNVSFADLKQALLYFAQEMFGAETKIRLRPSYFPFTEPSAEMDVSCSICNQKGCNVCKYSGWLEILGCGMVDPNVLKNCNIDPEIYSGYAFGMGVERITQLKYRVNDLRLYSENDVRFLKQFHSENN